MAQMMPLPLAVSCFSKIQTGSGTGSRVIPDKVQRAIKRVCVCMCAPELAQSSDIWEQTDSTDIIITSGRGGKVQSRERNPGKTG